MKKSYLLLGSLILSVACNIPTSRLTPVPTPGASIQTPPGPAQPATPAVSPTPVPLYFTEEFNTDLGAWTFFQTGGETRPTATVENDKLRVDIASAHTWYFGIHNSNTYKDVSVDTKFTGTPSGSMGLICRYSESGWYEFNIGSDGTYSLLLGRWLSDGIAQYLPIATDSSVYLQPGNMDYEIKLTCQGNTVLLYINGKLFRKMDVSHYGLTEGKVGITASSFEDTPATMFFEWLKVSKE